MKQRKMFSALDAINRVVLGARWNGDMEHSISDFIKLIKGAKSNVKIVAGELDHKLFEDKNVLGVVKDAIGRDDNPITIEILCGDKPDPETREIWKMSKGSGGRLQILKLKHRPSAHFVLVDDGKWVRIEQYHDAAEPERVAFTKKGSLFLGATLKEDFDTLKQHVAVR